MASVFHRWWAWMTVRDGTAASFWEVIGWWEARRLSYNLFVLALALAAVSLTILVISHLPPQGVGDLGDPLLAVFMAPILVNIAYTAGWVVEAALLWRDPVQPDGPRLMRAGLAFSALVMFAPLVIALAHALVSL